MTQKADGLFTGCANTSLRLLARDFAITCEPRLVLAQPVNNANAKQAF
jgi:hypothetical protein